MPRHKPDIFPRWEKTIIRLTVGSLILLAVAQAVLLFETPRRLLSQVDRLEGEAISWQTPLAAELPPASAPATPAAYKIERLRPSREISLRLVQPPADREIYLLINGGRQGDFAGGEISLTVYDGDYLEIDASRRGQPIRLVVHQSGLETPVDGAVLEGAGAILPIGKVKLRP